MGKITYKSRAEIIQKPYLSIQDIRGLVPIGYQQARKIMTEIRNDLEKRGIPTFKTKQLLAPTDDVLKRLGLNAKAIHKQAKEIYE